ncbi:MAG: methyltransferase domain-containing protein [Anaerolineaceae bacterium]|nr:methyltransferase domain-containing protein [Anaerolineaceae bacterium]
MKHSFYGKVYAQGYEIGTDASATVGFYLEQWKRLGGKSPVLEPMCGTGLNLIPFLEAGAVCDGLDASEHMLEVCRKKLHELNLTCNLYHQNLEAMELRQRYAFIMIPDGSFGHISDKAVAAQCLKRLQAHLLPDGWLVFDVRPPAFMSVFGEHGAVDHELTDYPDGSTVFTTGFWQHLEDGKVIRKWNKMERFVDERLVETEVFDYYERLYELVELQSILTTTGFEEIHVTKAYEFNKPPEGKDGIVFCCRHA